MKILVNGAAGLIGSAVCARLARDGHDVVAAVRHEGDRRPPGASAVVVAEMGGTPAGRWAELLQGVDVVVNCAGTFQDSARDSTSAVHVTGADQLFSACEDAGVRRVIHFSAIGVDRETPSAFSATKREGDENLKRRNLDWVILRPSVVLGRGVYGASALFRGLAALPLLPLMQGTGELQVVQLDDVAETVARLVAQDAPAKQEIELVGPERLSFAGVIAEYRRWLGWKPARTFAVPRFLETLLYKLGDAAGWLGWRTAVRSTASREIGRGAVGDGTAWRNATGIEPVSLRAALAAQPATVQERWFARLFLLKPVIFVVLAAFWLATGIISLTVGYDIGVGLMLAGGAGILAGPSVVAGALADIVIGLSISFRRTTRLGLWGAILLSLFYAVAGTLILPELWKEPLGPLLKIWPILVLHFVALGILEER